MPAQYERIKESYEKRGKSLKTSEKLAAMTYNAHRPAGAAPVTRNSDKPSLGSRFSGAEE